MDARSGGLVLCACGHPQAYHVSRPAWFYHAGSSAAAKSAPSVFSCAFCKCSEFEKGQEQGYKSMPKEA